MVQIGCVMYAKNYLFFINNIIQKFISECFVNTLIPNECFFNPVIPKECLFNPFIPSECLLNSLRPNQYLFNHLIPHHKNSNLTSAINYRFLFKTKIRADLY